jgi:thioredoxin 1
MKHLGKQHPSGCPAARLGVLLLAALCILGCSDSGAAKAGGGRSPTNLTPIADETAFDQLLRASGDRVLVVEFYADWCAPCKLLAPILAQVAEASGDLAGFYAVDVDRNRNLARRMGVSGIPNVLLIREGKVLQHLRGVLPQKTYLAAIREAARKTAPGAAGGSKTEKPA